MEISDRRARLREIRILASLDEVSLDRLGAALTWKQVKSGDAIISHLDLSAHVYFAVEGAFRARLTSPVGRTVAIRPISAGSHFGEIAALTNTPRSVEILAESQGLIAECPQDAFLDLMASHAAFATAVAAHLARTAVSLTDRVFELAALEVRFRIYTELLRLAAAGEITDDGPLVRNAPTHEAIAAAVGAQREAVTREMRMLASEGLVQQTKRELLILDVEELRNRVRRRAGVTTSDAVDWVV